MRTVRLLLAALSSCLVVAARPAAQGLYRDLHPARVWTVNASGGADFIDLPEAVRAARSGDVLLVAPGDYTSFELRGKGLTIVGDGGVPRILGAVTVTRLPAEQDLVLRALELVFDGPLYSGTYVRLEGNAGSVWIEDCTIRNAAQFALFGVLAMDSESVLLVRTNVIGPLHFPPTGIGVLHDVRSVVHAHESLFQATVGGIAGGNGSDSGVFGRGAVGGVGATLVDSFLHAAGSTFRGGRGRMGQCSGFSGLCNSPGGPGGPGLDASSSATIPVTVACTFQGGLGAEVRFCGAQACPAGANGPPNTGTLSVEPLPLRSYELETPVRSGTSYQLNAECEPGEFVWSVFSEHLDPTYAPNYFGTQVGALPVTLVFEGVADGSGSLSKSVPIPPLAALTSFERLFAQGLFFDALNNAYLGSPSVLVVVN